MMITFGSCTRRAGRELLPPDVRKSAGDVQKVKGALNPQRLVKNKMNLQIN